MDVIEYISNWMSNMLTVIFYFPKKIEQLININAFVAVFPKMDHNFIVLVFLSCLLISLLWYLLLRKVRNEDIKIPSLRSISAIVPKDDKPRFRKRDKIRYYATRLNRKFQDLTTHLQNIKSKDQKQKLMSIFAKKILNLKEPGPKLLKRIIPDTFLEPDVEEDDHMLPEEFQLMLDSIKVFGHMEKHFLVEFCKNIETVKLDAGQFLFKKGESDDNVFVVKNGKVRVYIEEGDTSMTIHEVQRGGTIHSLLSMLDVITGNIQPYKTVHAVAVMPSEVLRLRAESFITMFKQSPESMVRVVQLIAMRLQRVTFLCLHYYLGLSSELINKNSLALPNSKVVKLNKKIPNISSQSLMRQITAGLDVQKASTKVENDNELDKDNVITVVKDRRRSRSRSQSPAGLLGHQLTGISTDSQIFTFENIDNTEVFVEGTELEYGEIPGSNANLVRKVSLKERKRNKSEKLKTRANSDLNEEEKESVSVINNSSDLFIAAMKDIAEILGLKDTDALSSLNISLVAAGTTLVKEGEEDTDIYFVVSGELQVLQNTVGNEPQKMAPLFITHAGDLCGVETVITTEPSFYTIKALKAAYVVILSRQLIYSLIKNDSNVLLKLGNLLVRRMSPFLRQIDFALEWGSVKAGYPLYKAGDISKSVYIILNGRFRQICIKPDGVREIVNELGRGELIGFVEVLCNQPRATTVMAIRDSEVAHIPVELLSWIKRKAPQVVTRLIQLLADKLLLSMNPRANSLVKTPVGTMANLRTVAVVASSPDVPLESFVLELQHAMVNIGSSVRLTSNIILKRLGSKALDSVNEYRLLSWLSQQEDLHRMVFYVCDTSHNSVWTRRCIRQADCVLVVALASNEPKLGTIEQGMETDQTKVSKILVLLYPVDTDYPQSGKTSEWLNSRPWITQHYHIRCPRRVFIKRKRERLVSFYKRVFDKEVPNPHSDMCRLARYLTGTSIGLVLGGGGARGCSHVGAIRAMYEAGIPIDIVGGTSIGSFMSALWAEETRITQFTQRARAFAKEMSSVWTMILDLTYSPVSMFSGKAMNTALEKVFKDRQIEDLWIPYFCITTDITNSRMRIHTNGSLWRFVRASMSLSGYMPPLCHPDDGSLLLDGGYVNNLPADIMHEMGPELIFAIDVGSHDDTDLTNYGDWLSGGRILYNRLFSRSPMKILSLTEIQSRLAFVSCVRQLEQVKASGICEYLRPPIIHYKTLQFGSFDEIQEVGYQYGKTKIAEWQADDSLIHFRRKQLFWQSNKLEIKSTLQHSPILKKRAHTNSKNFKEYVLGSSSLDMNRKNFIDLAELVSRIGQEDHNFYESDANDDDMMVEYLAKITMNSNDEMAEILFRTKNSPYDINAKIGNNKESITRDVDQTDNGSVSKIKDGNTLSKSDRRNSSVKEEDGYDEDLEDEENNIGVTASDPENFHRVLVSTKRRRHRRSSLNRLHKSVTFDQSIDLS